jgi:hypothetical protein
MAPSRRSGRITVDRLKAELELARENGDDSTVELKSRELEDMLKKKEDSRTAGVSYEQAEPTYMRHTEPNMALLDESDVAGKVAVVNVLKACTAKRPHFKTLTADKYADAISNLSLQEQDVAKVTISRITSVAFLQVDRLLLAAADKAGCLGIWDVDGPIDSSVCRYSPHVQGISKLHASASNCALLYSVTN